MAGLGTGGGGPAPKLNPIKTAPSSAPVAPPPAPTPATPPQPRPVTPYPTVEAPKPTDTSAIQRRLGELPNQFDRARQRAKLDEGLALQDQREAMSRAQAQLGGGPTGAFVKMGQQAGDASARRLIETNLDIGAAESGVLEQRREAQLGRDFQAGESALDRGLQRYGIDTNRDLTLNSQDLQRYGIDVGAYMQRYGIDVGAETSKYQVDENAKTARADIDARIGIAEKELAAKVEQGQLSHELAVQQLETLKAQFEKEFQQNVLTNFVNGILSGKNSGIDPGKMAEMLMGLGVVVGPNGNISVQAPSVPGVTAPGPASGGQTIPGLPQGPGGTKTVNGVVYRQDGEGIYRDALGNPLYGAQV